MSKFTQALYLIMVLITEFQKIVFRKFKNLAEDLREVRRATFEHNSRADNDGEDFTSIPRLPLNTATEITALHEWADSDDNYTLLVMLFQLQL